MATIHRKDTIRDSWLQQSLEDVRRNRAQRGFHLKSLPGTSFQGDLAAANTYLLANLPAAHDQDETLPLIDVRSRNLKLGQTRSVALYGHTRHSNPTYDPFEGVQTAFVGVQKAEAVYSYTLDDGEEEGFTKTQITDPGVYWSPAVDGATLPTADQYKVITSDAPVWQITVTAGRLTAAQLADVIDLSGSLNQTAVQLGPWCFPAEEVQFISARSDKVHSSAGVLSHFTEYIYRWRRGGWANWSVNGPIPTTTDIDPSGNVVLGNAWIISKDNPGPVEEWADAFPLFDETMGPQTCSAGSSSSSAGGV